MKLILFILVILFTNQLNVKVQQETQIKSVLANMKVAIDNKDITVLSNQLLQLEQLTGSNVKMNKEACLKALKALKAPLEDLLHQLEHFHLHHAWKDVEKFIHLAELALKKCE